MALLALIPLGFMLGEAAANADDSETFTIYLDINNDGSEEIIDYIQERNVLRIRSNNRQLLLEANLDYYSISSGGIGMGTVLNSYEFVRDSAGKVYLHIYTSSFIGDDPNGERYTSAMEKYYDLKNYELAAVDTINYTWVWDRIQSESEMTDIYINGQLADSLDSIKLKYTVIENTYVEIP
jgi:hypothetical protein